MIKFSVSLTTFISTPGYFKENYTEYYCLDMSQRTQFVYWVTINVVLKLVSICCLYVKNNIHVILQGKI